MDVLKDPNDSTSKESRLVARGDRDALKDEYTEVYAPVARMTSLRIYLEFNNDFIIVITYE